MWALPPQLLEKVLPLRVESGLAEAQTEMATAGGSIDERLKVQAQLTQVGDKLQDLGVALGDFNAENEFCTIKLTLRQVAC